MECELLNSKCLCSIQPEQKYMYGQTCVKRPYTTRHILASQTGGCLLLHESSAERHYMCTFIQQ